MVIEIKVYINVLWRDSGYYSIYIEFYFFGVKVILSKVYCL